MNKIFSEEKNELIFTLSGELDQYAVAELKEHIDFKIQTSKKRNVIINLKSVEMMDSSGIGLIVGRYKLTTSLGGKFAICNPNENIKRILLLSGITKVIKCCETLSEAKKSFIE